MSWTILFAASLFWSVQPASQPDPVSALVMRLEQAAAAGDRAGIRALGANPAAVDDLASALTIPTPSRIVIKERDRTDVEGGDRRLLLEIFWERGIEARLATWTVDVTAVDGEWRFAEAARLANVTGLYRLNLNPRREFAVRNLTVKATDLTLHIPSGSAFVAETPEGPTAVVLLGRGEARFTPPDPAEQTQLRIFSGSTALVTPIDAAFVRLHPDDFDSLFSATSMTERSPNAAALRRGDEIFEEYVGRTLQIDLMDLSAARWSIVPPRGDLIAEIRTRRHGTLTYTRTTTDPEDITLFDRRRRRNIAVYASTEKLASRGRFYSEDDRVDYDVLHYDLDTIILPETGRVEGITRLKVRIRGDSANTVNLRLAESLVVRGVFSPGHGRLLHLRIVNQNSLIVSLPGTLLKGTELWLSIAYAGNVPPQELDREAIDVAQDILEPVQLPPEPRFLYSNRTYWYPQSIVSDYATATLRIAVPEGFDVVASGTQVGQPAPPPGVVEGTPRRVFSFEADRPVRYLAAVISRLRDVTTTVAQWNGGAEEVPLTVKANPRQAGRARSMAGRTAEIFGYYASLLDDAPYPALSIVWTERDLPGGHSPAYFVVIDQPQRGFATWRNDPVAFDNYPAFFLAHEIAHQWWGQGVGWKNYHEQWLSEGFSQYFAMLYAESLLAGDVATNVRRQMRTTAIAQSDNGPVYLGYRLGHIQRDARVFRSLVYNKAAMVLHMLRRLIGDEAFFKGVREFYQEFKYRKAGTGDLILVMERASGRSLSRFFDTWIFGEAIPSVRLTRRAEGSTVVLQVEQQAAPVEFPLTVRLTYRSGRTDDVLLIISEKVSEYRVETIEPLRSVTANADHGSLVVVR